MTSPDAPPNGPQPQLRAVAHGLTDRGMQRELNEDSFTVLNDHGLFVVADGMGGHQAGDVASRIATETIAEFFRSTATEDVTWPFHFDTSLTEEENRLLTGIRVANRQILERSEKSRECHGMGTTVVGAMFSPAKNKLFIGHVGDSRCYRVRQGQIKLLTRDHSLVNDYITAIPNLTDEQKADLPRNVITRALGMQKDVIVDLQADEPQSGDIYLLCSDGLNSMLHDQEILEAVHQHGTDLHLGARRLIDHANASGGEDNITVVLILIEGSPGFTLPISSSPSSPSFHEDDTQSASSRNLAPPQVPLSAAPVTPHLPPLTPVDSTPPAPANAPASTPPVASPGPFLDDDTLVSGEVPKRDPSR